MNWLAHVFLSEPDIRFQLGNLLADNLKCRPWPGMSEMGRQGIERHKWIDVTTDRSPIVRRSKGRLARKGRLRGIAIDIVYDHMLTLNWDRFSNVSMGEYLNAFYAGAKIEIAGYPPKPKEFVEWIIRGRRLNLYDSIERVGQALQRIERRLSERVTRTETLSGYLPAIEANHAELESDFLEFLPWLIERMPPPGELDL